MKTAQVSIELLAAVGIIFLILLFLLGLNFSNKISLLKNERFVNQRSECIRVSSLIFNAFLNGKGTIIHNKIKYNMSLSPNSRLLSTKDKEEVYCTIPINTIPDTTINKGNIRIENRGDFVDVKNI